MNPIQISLSISFLMRNVFFLNCCLLPIKDVFTGPKNDSSAAWNNSGLQSDISSHYSCQVAVTAHTQRADDRKNNMLEGLIKFGMVHIAHLTLADDSDPRKGFPKSKSCGDLVALGGEIAMAQDRAVADENQAQEVAAEEDAIPSLNPGIFKYFRFRIGKNNVFQIGDFKFYQCTVALRLQPNPFN